MKENPYRYNTQTKYLIGITSENNDFWSKAESEELAEARIQMHKMKQEDSKNLFCIIKVTTKYELVD